MKRTRRTWLHLCYDILNRARGNGATKYHLIYDCNLAPQQATLLIEKMRHKGLLVQIDRIWYTTDKGIRFMAEFEELTGLLR